MDEIGQRLKENAEACMTAYEAWLGSKKDFEARERLQEAVHELRKVSARLEIEMAASERDEMTQRPIPVPPHRASRRRDQEGNDLPGFITEGGSGAQGGDNGRSHKPSRSGGGVRRSGGRRPPQQGQASGSEQPVE